MMKDNAAAVFFYEQCTGAIRTQRAYVPHNHPVFSLIQSWCGYGNERCTSFTLQAVSQPQFIQMIREVADSLHCFNDNPLAEFFYTYCTSQKGNNTILYDIVSSYTKTKNIAGGTCKVNFIQMLREFADQLEGTTNE